MRLRPSWCALLGALLIGCPAEETATPTSDMGVVDTPQDITQDVTPSVDMTEDTPQDMPVDVSQDTSPDMAPDLTEDAAPDLPDDMLEEMPSDMMEDMAPDLAQDMPPEMMGLPGGPSSDRQTARAAGTTAANRGYHEYLPPGYGDGQDRPLLVFLHGLGENGNGDSDLSKVLRNGPPRLIDRDDWDSARPFIVLSPQHPGGGCFGAGEIRDFLSYAVANYDVDLTRVYLTGLSCGAIGTWNFLGRELNKTLAAVVPIAGNGNNAWNRAMCDLGLTPIWAFHGDADNVVNVGGTNNPIDDLLMCPSPPRAEVKKTIYPGVGHNSWRRTYDGSAGHDIYTWMLSKTNPGAVAP